MTNEDRAFYKDLFPCLNDDRWQETGAESFGSVRWYIPFGFASECGDVSARIGLIVYPTSAKLFVQVTTHYPEKTYTQNLKRSPESSSMFEIENEVRDVARSLITSNMEEIKAAQATWQQELEQMRGGKS